MQESKIQWQVFEYFNFLAEKFNIKPFLIVKLTQLSEPFVISVGGCDKCKNRKCANYTEFDKPIVLETEKLKIVFCEKSVKKEELEKVKLVFLLFLKLFDYSLACTSAEEKERLKNLILGIRYLIRKTSDLEDLLLMAVDVVSTTIECNRISIMLEENDYLTIKASRGIPADVVKKVKVIPGEGIAGKVYKEARSIYVIDIEEDTRFSRKNRRYYRSKSFISTPIISDKGVIGVINLSEKVEGKIFTPEDLELIEFLSYIIANLIEQSRMNITLNEQKKQLQETVQLYENMYTLISKLFSITNTLFLHLEQSIDVIFEKVLDVASQSLEGLNLMAVFLTSDFGNSVFVWPEEKASFSLKNINIKQKVDYKIKDSYFLNENTDDVSLYMLIDKPKLEYILEKLDLKKEGLYNYLFPLFLKKQLYGILIYSFYNQLQSEADSDFLFNLAKQLTMALYNIKLKQESVEVATFKRELELGKTIQQQMFPKKMVDRIDQHNWGINIPAEVVGGDFFDWIEKEDGVMYFIADVSGKGIPAALMVSELRAVIRANIDVVNMPSQLLRIINSYFIEKNADTSMFLTAFCIWIDREGNFKFVRAGHNPPFLVKSKEEKIEFLDEPGGILVGNFDFAIWKEGIGKLQSGDKILLYTDGMNEAFNKEGLEYGMLRPKNILKDTIELSPEETIDKILYDLKRFVGSAKQSDDITMVCIKMGTNEKNELVFSTEEKEKYMEFVGILEQTAVEYNYNFYDLNDMLLIVDELVNNAVEHGNRNIEGKKVYVKYKLWPEGYFFEIKDEGIGFDFERKLNAATKILDSRGRGLKIIDKIVNKFKYDRQKNTLRVVRYFWMPKGEKIY